MGYLTDQLEKTAAALLIKKAEDSGISKSDIITALAAGAGGVGGAGVGTIGGTLGGIKLADMVKEAPDVPGNVERKLGRLIRGGRIGALAGLAGGGALGALGAGAIAKKLTD